MGAQRGRHLLVVQIFFGDGIVGRLYTVLQGQIQAGGCLAATRGTDENQVCLVVMTRTGAVIVIQREIDGMDAPFVAAFIVDGVRLAYGIG